MPSFTDRLALMRHTLSDRFRVQDYADNWNRLDEFPGTFICTSATRPNDWGALQEGLSIYETDTTLTWHWDGAAFIRTFPQGVIGYDSATTPYVTSDPTYELPAALSVAVTVAEGNRRHLVIVEGPGVANPGGGSLLRLRKSGDAGDTLQEWSASGPLAMTSTDTPVAGSYTYALEVKADGGGTVTLSAAVDSPLAMTVMEM